MIVCLDFSISYLNQVAPAFTDMKSIYFIVKIAPDKDKLTHTVRVVTLSKEES